MEQPPHPPLLISLCAGLFVVLALIASADASVFGSDRFKEAGTCVRVLLVAPMVFVAVGGACAVWAGNAAYNIAHRSWKLVAVKTRWRAALEAPPPWPWPTTLPASLTSMVHPSPSHFEFLALSEDIDAARRTSAKLIRYGSACAVLSIVFLLVAFATIVVVERPAVSEAEPAPESVKSNFELLGTIGGFKPGSGVPDGADLKAKIASIRSKWCTQRLAGRQGLLLIIGATDRMPLKITGRKRFGSNVGLAQSRAATVANLLFPTGQPNMITLPAGPDSTPPDTAAIPALDFAQDRRVTLWAIWGPAPRGQSAEECRQNENKD